MTITALKPLPIGTTDFESLHDAEQLYVDITPLICELARLRQKFVLTRPARFGKTLLVSTFASLLLNGLTYFSGLAIEKLWKDRTYTVAKIDFADLKNLENIQYFHRRLDDLLIDAFEPAGFRCDKSNRQNVIRQVSRWMKTLPVNSLVHRS